MKAYLTGCLLIVSLVAFSQERQVEILPEAGMLTLDREKGEKTYFSDDYPGFSEASLYQLPDSSYVLEVFYKKDGEMFKERKPMSPEAIEAFRTTLYNQYFFGHTEGEFNQNGRTLLVAGSSFTGLSFYGYALPLMLQVDDEKPFIALYMLTAGGSFLLPYSITKRIVVTKGQGSMTFWGQSRGIYHGMALSLMIDDDSSVEALMGLGMAASIGEGILNFHLAKNWNYRSGEASMYQMGGDMGIIGGLLMADVLDLYDNESFSGVFLSSIAGSIAGMTWGKVLADTRNYTVGDAIYFRSSIVLGSYLGLSFVNLVQPENSKAYTISALAGGVAGSAFALNTLRGKDFTTGQGILVGLGELAGGLLGFGLGYLVVDDISNSEIILLMSSLGAVGGFSLLSSQLSPKNNTTVEGINLELNINPLAMPQIANRLEMPPLPGVQLRLTF